MGLLWRLFAPKPLKKARRSVYKATHPVKALTPKPVRRAKRAAFRVAHPVEALEGAVENQIVRSLRGASKRRGRAAAARIVVPAWVPARVTQQWIETNGPRLDQTQRRQLIAVLRTRNWTEADLRQRVYPHLH
jgi:hypothetical protein